MPPSPPSYETLLTEAKDGTGDLLYEASGFTARIARDGAVSFHDKHLTLLSLFPLTPVAGPRNVPSLQATLSGLVRNSKVPPRDDRARNDTSYLIIPMLTPYRPDPREACRECSVPYSLLPAGASLGLDLTDEVMRMSGQDPYRYEKARFLVGTRDLRVRKATRARSESIRNANVELSRQLREIACDRRRSVRERHQIIQALREDLDGSTPEAQAAAAEIDKFTAASPMEEWEGSPLCGQGPADAEPAKKKPPAP